MKIILEGCDGTGKTTLAKILADKYGLDICHCTQHDAKDYDFYRQTLRKDNVVWDRHTIGELIYPKIFGRDHGMSPEDARLVISHSREEGVRTFVLTCDPEVIRRRLRDRGTEDYRIIVNSQSIDSLFKHYAREFDIPIIDTTKMTLDQIFTLVETPQSNNGKFIY